VDISNDIYYYGGPTIGLYFNNIFIDSSDNIYINVMKSTGILQILKINTQVSNTASVFLNYTSNPLSTISPNGVYLYNNILYIRFSTYIAAINIITGITSETATNMVKLINNTPTSSFTSLVFDSSDNFYFCNTNSNSNTIYKCIW
jgi:hypothetical protein